MLPQAGEFARVWFMLEPMLLSKGGVQRVLFRFTDGRVKERLVLAIDEVFEGFFDGKPS